MRITGRKTDRVYSRRDGARGRQARRHRNPAPVLARLGSIPCRLMPHVRRRGRGHAAPRTSCTLEAREGMAVKTHTPRVLAARRNIIELLVASHPNDCLVCSRSKDCELSRLASNLGRARASLQRRQKDARHRPLVALARARSEQMHSVRPLRHHVPHGAGRRRHRLHRTAASRRASAPAFTRV